MGKIGLIIGREYLTRVKKKSFIIMTILGPILMAAAMLIPAYLSIKSVEKPATIGVIDESLFYEGAFKNKEQFNYINLSCDIEDGKKLLFSNEITYLVYIPATDSCCPSEAIFYGKQNVTHAAIAEVKSVMSDAIEITKLKQAGIEPSFIANLKGNVNIKSYKIDDSGNEKRSYTTISQIFGYVCGFLIYMFIVMYGNQVMRGVMEEKSSRIVEVIISSVKPFQLMMGKIIGVGLVGLTQFALWILLTIVLVFSFSGFILNKGDMLKLGNSKQVNQIIQESTDKNAIDTIDLQFTSDVAKAKTNTLNVEIFDEILSIDLHKILLFFLIYFLGGYLLYSSMFAAVGGAIDNEDDLQQFVLPLTIFIIIPLMLITNIVNDPSGSIAVWLSMIPFTSPIAMMIRLPFSVVWWQLLLSVVLLIATFVLMTWLSGKIYRTGILMYGKKITWSELWKWLRY